MGTHQPIRKAVVPEIPDKLYFRIGDVARLCEVPTYVLRFWETEFPQLKPNKGGTGQRLYRRRDVELALRIKSLLYDQGYTIPGARQVFKNESASRTGAEPAAPVTVAAPIDTASATVAPLPAASTDSGALLRQQARLRDLREEMVALLSLLGKPVSESAPDTAPQPEPKVHAMRPRLVLEPRPKREPIDGAGLFGGSKLQITPPPQRDLFAMEPSREDDWPEPPVAS